MVLADMEAVVPRQALIEVPTMRRFAGIDLFSDRIPDETTIPTIRHLLEKHQLGEHLYGFAEDFVYETVPHPPTAEPLHDDEQVDYVDAGYQGIAKRPELPVSASKFRVAVRPGKCRALPETLMERSQVKSARHTGSGSPEHADQQGVMRRRCWGEVRTSGPTTLPDHIRRRPPDGRVKGLTSGNCVDWHRTRIARIR